MQRAVGSGAVESHTDLVPRATRSGGHATPGLIRPLRTSAALACAATLALAVLATLGQPAPIRLSLVTAFKVAKQHACRSASPPRPRRASAPPSAASGRSAMATRWSPRRGHPRHLHRLGGSTCAWPRERSACPSIGVGHGRRLQSGGRRASTRSASEVIYRQGSISESYRNGPYGLEQGFTVAHRPRAQAADPLVLALRIGGSLTPSRRDRKSCSGPMPARRRCATGDLSAVDATGRRLPAHMQLRNGAVELRIDDSHARYPLRIDPFFQQGEKLTGGRERGRRLRQSVALSADGNTALIGAHDSAATSARRGCSRARARPGPSRAQSSPAAARAATASSARASRCPPTATPR